MKSLVAGIVLLLFSTAAKADDFKCTATEFRPDGTKVEAELTYAGWGHGRVFRAESASLKYLAIEKGRGRIFLEITSADDSIMVSRDEVDLTAPPQPDPQLQIDIKDLRAQLNCKKLN